MSARLALTLGLASTSHWTCRRRSLRACCGRAPGQAAKIITVHSVRAAKAVLDHVEEHLPQRSNRVVLHWFTGSKSEASARARLGLLLLDQRHDVEQREGAALVRTLPVERMLTETDGPFTEVAGRPSKPADVAGTIGSIAALLGLSAASLAGTMKDNLRRLLEETDVSRSRDG
jgi:TatD DNase family protein